MPAIVPDDIAVLPRIPTPDPAIARERVVRGVTTDVCHVPSLLGAPLPGGTQNRLRQAIPAEWGRYARPPTRSSR